MKISEYIKKLEEIKTKIGDVEVEKENCVFDRITAYSPEISYRKILNRRESKPRFWCSYAYKEEEKGEIVCKV